MEPIRTALCSFGMSGWVFHAPFIQVHPGFELYAVWERTKKLAQEKYPDVKSFNTLEAMLEDDAIELVVVNTPNYTHFEFAKLALQAGKHVIVEKPFTVFSKEAKELIRLAKKQNRKLSVYQNRRYDSDFRIIKKVVQEKLLGDLVEAEFHFDRYKEELSPKLHKETPGPGTGSVYDLGSHLIDQAFQLFGDPIELFADIQIMRPISKVDDYFELLLYYPSFRVRLKSSYQVREPLPGYVLHGSKGSFIKPRTDVHEASLQAGKIPGGADWGIEPEAEKGLLHTERGGRIIREYLPSLKGNYLEYYDGMYNAIRNYEPVPVAPEDGAKVVRLIETAYESSKKKKVIEFH